jgi:hypothetical protein
MGAEPVLGVYAGYSLRGEYVKPGPDLAPYVQDALDEIEYVTGPVTTKWGAQRAKDGHPKPFPLRYVEVGNEDFFDRSGSYDGRFAQFYDAIKAKYPRLKVISSVGFEQPEQRRVRSRKPTAWTSTITAPPISSSACRPTTTKSTRATTAARRSSSASGPPTRTRISCPGAAKPARSRRRRA